MHIISKYFICFLITLFGATSVNAQKSCCKKTTTEQVNCGSDSNGTASETAKACCSTKLAETTSGCTPSQCRGEKTKFGEAKVITDLRLSLVALKAKMEVHPEYKFSNEAITVHGIVGDTDNESLKIVSNHIQIIESEILAFASQELPVLEENENKAVLVKQLNERITELNKLL